MHQRSYKEELASNTEQRQIHAVMRIVPTLLSKEEFVLGMEQSEALAVMRGALTTLSKEESVLFMSVSNTEQR